MCKYHDALPESYPPELAVLKAIAEEQKTAMKRNAVKRDPPPTAKVSDPFSQLRTPHPIAAKHGEARILVERILERARRIVGCENSNETFPELDFFPMVQFAQCSNATIPLDCHGQYRTIDGKCNNVNDPLRGSANSPFRRLLPACYEDGIYVPIGATQAASDSPFSGPWPSPRTISRRIITNPMDISNQKFSMIFTVFGQSITLDISRTAEFNTLECFQSCNISENLPFCAPVLIEDDDPSYGVNSSYTGSCLFVRRTIGACMAPFDSTFDQPRQQINQPTQYLDGSSIYGNSDEVATALRLFRGGQINLSARTNGYKGDLVLLPEGGVPGFGPSDVFLAGDGRIENYVHQINMYVLWYRLHNYIVGELESLNPCWNDERLYQEGRKIVVAIWQVVIYKEYLPLLFEDQFDTYIGDYTGYDPSVDTSLSFGFATGAFRFGHSMFHSSTQRLNSDGSSISVGPLDLRVAFFHPEEYYNGEGLDPLLRGMLADHSTELDQFLSMVLTTQLFPRNPSDQLGQDLATRNIQRAREQGVPPYRRWREYCESIYNVSATFPSETDQDIREVYGDDGYASGIDLWVGGISENLLQGSNVGPTFACILGEGFTSLRAGDRFYWENPTEFNSEQRESLSQMTISKVICENADDIPNIRRQAFLTSGDPVSCDSLPFVDLDLWKDGLCDNIVVDSGTSATYGWSMINIFLALLPFLFALF